MDATKFYFKSPVQPRKAYNWKLILQNVIDTLLLRRLSRSHASIDRFIQQCEIGTRWLERKLEWGFYALISIYHSYMAGQVYKANSCFQKRFAKDCLIDCLGVVVYQIAKKEAKTGPSMINSLICAKRWTLSWMYQVFLHSPHMVNVSFMTSARPLRIYTGMIWKR